MRETWIIVPVLIFLLTFTEILKTDSKQKQIFHLQKTPKTQIKINRHAAENKGKQRKTINSTEYHAHSTPECLPLATMRLNFTVINIGNLELDTINHLDFNHVKVGLKSVGLARFEILKSEYPINSIVLEVYEKTDVLKVPKVLRKFESMTIR